MNIALINPPNIGAEHYTSTKTGIKDLGVYPPLGLLYVAAYLELYTDCKIDVIDLQFYNNPIEEIIENTTNNNYDIIGISCLSSNLWHSLQYLEIIKNIDPKVITVLGGYHPSIYPKETIFLPNVDYIVTGHNISSFAGLVKYLKDNRNDWPYFQGIYNKLNIEKISDNEEYYYNIDLDEFPFPARHLIDNKKYYSVIVKYKPMTCMMASMGCAFNCIFCNTP